MSEHQTPLFIEDNTKYLCEIRGRTVELWRLLGGWITPNSVLIADEGVTVIERIGTAGEVFK